MIHFESKTWEDASLQAFQFAANTHQTSFLVLAEA